MITFKVQGGLGNQLFQYAFAYRIFLDYGYLPNLDLTFFDGQFSNQFKLDKFNVPYTNIKYISSKNITKNKYLKKIYDLVYYNSDLLKYPSSREINIDILNNPFKKLQNLNSNNDYCLYGWMQNIDFFAKYRNELSEMFWLKPEYIKQYDYQDIMQNSNSVSVHVRRGDMEKNENFNVLDKTYYTNAIKFVIGTLSNPHFYVFSDEPEKAKLLFSKMHNMTFISENSQSSGYYGTSKDYQDFQLMRYCIHHIIANSTFSWWPAYLNSAKSNIVVAPRIWYKDTHLQNQFQKSSILLSNWIKF